MKTLKKFLNNLLFIEELNSSINKKNKSNYSWQYNVASLSGIADYSLLSLDNIRTILDIHQGLQDDFCGSCYVPEEVDFILNY